MDFARHTRSASHPLTHALAQAEPYLRRRATAAAGEHAYLMGLQHQRTGSSLFWEPLKASVIYFFQNDAGAARWPIGDDFVRRILAAFRGPPVGGPQG
mgnify:CR=1 FL=1